MSSHAKQNITLSAAVECDEICSPHWPKTLVSISPNNTQLQKPHDNARQHHKSLSSYLKNLRRSRR
jgi:hypothetical protein